MMTADTLALVLSWVSGVALGAFFFGGLWWTVRKSLASDKAALWVFGSLLLRMGVILTGFYLVSGGDWQRLLSSLVGFIMTRQMVMRLTHLPKNKSTCPVREIRHAP
jgi:F1F0 ATPase subunit 2